MLRSSCRAAAASGTLPSPAPPPDASEAHLREDQRAEPGRTGAAPALGRPRFARRPLDDTGKRPLAAAGSRTRPRRFPSPRTAPLGRIVESTQPVLRHAIIHRLLAGPRPPREAR